METTPFTVRNATKFVAKTIVQLQAAQLTQQTITDHTQFEEDDTIVNLSSYLVGWYAADKLKPVTDRMVDKAADFIVAKRTKKTSTPPTE